MFVFRLISSFSHIVSNEVHPFMHRHSPPGSQPLSSPNEIHRRDSHCPSLASSYSVDSQSSVASAHGWIKAEDEDEKKSTFFGDVPEGKKRKFILVDDLVRGTRVRVHVELDNIKMEEMPDFHLQKNSVFPRQFYPRQMRSPSDSPSRTRDLGDAGSTDQEDSPRPIRSETCVSVPLLDGSQTVLPVPQISKDIQNKECALNELGYRMSWRQAKTFNERTIFMQKSRELQHGSHA